MIRLDKFIDCIDLSIKERFIIDDSDIIDKLMTVSPSELLMKKILRLKRINCPDLKTYKTILLVGIADDKDMTNPLKWAATVKEILLDPESADLYLFVYQSGNISLETCLRIESTEQFCRKYILHPKETVEHFLDRTFFAKMATSSEEGLSEDPLLKAFAEVQKEHKWLTPYEQKRWNKIFLSGKSSSELVEDLFTTKTNNDETPE